MSNYLIEEAGQLDQNKIFPLLARSHFGPYRNLSLKSGAELQQYWVKKITDSAQKGNSKAFMVERNNKLIGFIQAADLDWDSRIFGIPMCSIQELIVDANEPNRDEIIRGLLSIVLDWSRKQDYRFILAKTYTNDIHSIHALEQAGFLLVDTLLFYEVNFQKTPFSSIPIQERSKDVIIRMAEPKDEAELKLLAKAAFKKHFGRYHSDPKLTNEQATQVYVEWINSSIHGYADYFSVAEVDGKIAGLTIWKESSELEKEFSINVIHHSLAAIHPDFFGRRLYTLLTYEGMKLFDGNSDIIESATHINNYPVQRGFNRLGWQIHDARHSFHKWLD